MPPIPNVLSDLKHPYLQQQQQQPYQNPKHQVWYPLGGDAPAPTHIPIHLPSSAPPGDPPPSSDPPPIRLRQHRPNHQQRPTAYRDPYPPLQPQPQSQMTQVPTQGHHSQPSNCSHSQSNSDPPPAYHPQMTHVQPPNHREDEDRHTILKGIVNDTIAALNNGIVDVSTTQQHTELFLQSSQELTDSRRPHGHHPSSTRTKIEVLAQSTLQGARHLHDLEPRSKIGVLNFASATKPGGGFLKGTRTQEASIARSSSLYASLTTDIARPFYALHAGRSENYGFYTHAMIYSPEVHLFRDDDGGWLEPIPVDIVTSPAVNAGEVRKRYPHKNGGLEKKIEDAMRERMGRILALFEMKGTTRLVLGSFGTGTFQNDVGVVARIWRDFLIGRDARFRSAFREVVFCILDAQTREVFEAALFSRGGGRRSYVLAHGGDEDGVP